MRRIARKWFYIYLFSAGEDWIQNHWIWNVIREKIENIAMKSNKFSFTIELLLLQNNRNWIYIVSFYQNKVLFSAINVMEKDKSTIKSFVQKKTELEWEVKEFLMKIKMKIAIQIGI